MHNPPRRAVVFCGIARPQRFVEQLKAAGITPVAQCFFRDHHAYSASDISRLLAMKESSGADGFITTEKDGINLGDRRCLLEPLCVVPVTMTLDDSTRMIDAMLAVIGTRKAIPRY